MNRKAWLTPFSPSNLLEICKILDLNFIINGVSISNAPSWTTPLSIQLLILFYFYLTGFESWMLVFCYNDYCNTEIYTSRHMTSWANVSSGEMTPQVPIFMVSAYWGLFPNPAKDHATSICTSMPPFHHLDQPLLNTTILCAASLFSLRF